MARQIKPRKQKRAIAIVGEGHTEKFYFEEVRRAGAYRFAIKPELPKHSAVKDIIHKAEELLKKEYDTVVTIFDLDTMKSTEKQDYDRFVKKYNGNKRVLTATVRPAIELWFILHFIETSREYADGIAVKKELRKYIPKYSTKQSYLRTGAFYTAMTEQGSLQHARSASKRLSEDTLTETTCEIFKVFDLLDSL